SDIYALGAVGYYLLSGRHVFEGNTIIEVCMQHLNAEPKPLSEVSSLEIPPGLSELVFACLAKSQSDRPASGQELADALDRLQAARWTRAQAEAWWETYGSVIHASVEPISSKVTERTVAIDFEER
ncbi:MAG: hypothetical protein WBG86_12450, partial [Polyangiales bacterium]